jgi:hypothetical protein
LDRDGFAAYFKRSWVLKKDGRFLGLPDFATGTDARFFPLQYALLERYRAARVDYPLRDISIACTIRPTVAVRKRVLQW